MTAVLRLSSTVPASVPDLARFAGDVAQRVNAAAWARDADAPEDDGPVFLARAPGRLDVMGGIADYSGSLVLQWPIREATRVAVRPWRQRRFSITSLSGAGERTCDVPLDLVADATRPYEHAAAWFAADPARHWAAYVAGVFHVLAREHGVRFAAGAAILIESDVPEGRGVSSSAAIEAATMEAACAAWHVSIDPTLRALRCQQVENLIVGAPCGVMDQMASICGEAESLMALLCQPAEFQGECPAAGTAPRLGCRFGDPPRDHRSGLRRRARGRVHGLPDPGRTGRAPGRIGEARGARAGRRPALGRLSRQCRHPDVPSIRARDPRIAERRCVPRPLSGDDGSRHSRGSVAHVCRSGRRPRTRFTSTNASTSGRSNCGRPSRRMRPGSVP